MSAWDRIRAAAGVYSSDRRDEFERGSRSLAAHGLTTTDEAGGLMRFETGHKLGITQNFQHGDWRLYLVHPNSLVTDGYGKGDYTKVIHTSLGTDHDNVGGHAARFLRRPDVMSAMADQMHPGEWPGYRREM